MKVNKKDNPFNVQAGQKWKSKDSRRQRKFVIELIDNDRNSYFAIVDYKNGLKTTINLKRFDRYTRCK